jgi:hypothetical protein
MANISNGLKIEIKALKSFYDAGELPDFNVDISNYTDKDILFCSYMLKHRLISTLYSDDFRVFPFVATSKPMLLAEDFLVMKPGIKLTTPINMSEESDYAFVREISLPKIVKKELAETGFRAGRYNFRINLNGVVSIYNAPLGIYNFERVRLQIPDDLTWDKETLSEIDISNVWKGDMNALCQLEFK